MWICGAQTAGRDGNLEAKTVNMPQKLLTVFCPVALVFMGILCVTAVLDARSGAQASIFGVFGVGAVILGAVYAGLFFVFKKG